MNQQLMKMCIPGHYKSFQNHEDDPYISIMLFLFTDQYQQIMLLDYHNLIYTIITWKKKMNTYWNT